MNILRQPFTWSRAKVQKIHNHGLDRLVWYRNWHGKSYHRPVHYAVAHLVFWPLAAVIVMSTFMTVVSLNTIWRAQQAQAAGQTWTSYTDFNSWTKTDIIATTGGSLSSAYTVGDASAVATISGFSQARAAATAPNGMLYVADYSGFAVQKVNPATNAIIQTISLIDLPSKIILASNNHLYVVAGSYLFEIDPATDALTGPFEIDINSVSWSLVQAPNGYLYVSNLSSNIISVVDPTSHAVVTTIDIGATTQGLAISDEGILFAVSTTGDAIVVIDTTDNSVVQTVTGFSSATEIAIADNGFIYVGNSGTHEVYKLDPTDYSVATIISVGQTPAALAKDTNGQIWVANMYSHNIMRINPSTDTVTATVSTSNNPWSFGFGADGDVYVGNMAAGTVNRVDTGVLTYSASGSASTSFTPSVGQNNSWSTVEASASTPTGTAVELAYSSDNATWKATVAEVPSSETLYVRASFTTSDTSVTASLNSLTINYDAVVGGGTGNEPVSNEPVTTTPTTNTVTPTTNTVTPATNEPATNTVTDTNTDTNTDTGTDSVVTEVAQPQNVQIYGGATGTTLTFTPPPAGHQIRIWRSISSSGAESLLESTSVGTFNDYDARPNATTDTYYYRLETYRLSDERVSEPVRVEMSYPRQYFYGIAINTNNVTLKTGESQQVTATVLDAAGNQVNLPISWSVSDERIGSITADGVFTAGSSTGYWAEGIRANVSADGLGGTATVAVGIDPLGPVVAAVALSPDSVTLKPGQTQNFQVILIDQYGARQSANQSNIEWETTVGTMNGSVLTAGTDEKLINDGVIATYVDDTGRSWRVQAKVAISQEEAVLTRVNMTNTQRLAVGSSFRYSSWGYDQFNNNLGSRPSRYFSSANLQAAVIDSAGVVHVGQEVGCFYWMLRGEQKYNGLEAYTMSGLITKPLTETETAAAENARYVGWRQVKYVLRPGEKFQFIAGIYNGWGKQVPGEFVEFEMGDAAAGTIETNGLFTASTAEGVYNQALNVYFHNSQTGERRLGAQIKLVISPETPVLDAINTVSIKTRSNWFWLTGFRLFNQFGLPYTDASRHVWSLIGGNSLINQSGLIATGAAERSDSVIDIAIATNGQEYKATTKGTITSTDDFSLPEACSVLAATANLGYFIGPDGELIMVENFSRSNIEESELIGATQSTVDAAVQTARRAQTVLVPLSALAVISVLAQVAGTATTRVASGFVGLLQFIGLSRRKPIKGAAGELPSPNTDGQVRGATKFIFWLGILLLAIGSAAWLFIAMTDGLDLLMTLLGAYYVLAWLLEHYVLTAARVRS